MRVRLWGRVGADFGECAGESGRRGIGFVVGIGFVIGVGRVVGFVRVVFWGRGVNEFVECGDVAWAVGVENVVDGFGGEIPGASEQLSGVAEAVVLGGVAGLDKEVDGADVGGRLSEFYFGKFIGVEGGVVFGAVGVYGKGPIGRGTGLAGFELAKAAAVFAGQAQEGVEGGGQFFGGHAVGLASDDGDVDKAAFGEDGGSACDHDLEDSDVTNEVALEEVMMRVSFDSGEQVGGSGVEQGGLVGAVWPVAGGEAGDVVGGVWARVPVYAVVGAGA